MAWVPQPDFERTVLKAHDRSSAADTRVGRAHGSYIQEMLKKSPDDAALQKPGHFWQAHFHMDARNASIGDNEEPAILHSASHTVAKRLGINGYA